MRLVFDQKQDALISRGMIVERFHRSIITVVLVIEALSWQ